MADKAESMKAATHRDQLASSQVTMLKQNTEITEQIDKLTQEIHRHLGIEGKAGAG